MASTKVYVYGSGSVGCLYDNGPFHATTLDEAIYEALAVFDDLPESELAEARRNLRDDGIHYFSPECRADAGADLVEISTYTVEPQIAALAAHLGVITDTISEARSGADYTYESSGDTGEYLVLTEGEADCVAHYDGKEREEQVDGVRYFIYRVT